MLKLSENVCACLHIDYLGIQCSKSEQVKCLQKNLSFTPFPLRNIVTRVIKLQYVQLVQNRTESIVYYSFVNT